MHINQFSDEVLWHIFSFIDSENDLDAISHVCQRWKVLARDPFLLANVERLEKIAFQNIERFKELPKESLGFKFRTFTIFNRRIIGETASGELMLLDPRRATYCRLDYTPPYQKEYAGKFLTNAKVCIYEFGRRDFFQVDVKRRSVKKLDFKLKDVRLSYGLCGSSIMSCKIKNPYDEPPFNDFSRKRRRYQCYPFLEVEIFNVEDKSLKTLTYPTENRPRLYFEGDRMIIQDRRWFKVVDENFKEISSTFWNLQYHDVYLYGTKLLFKASCWKGNFTSDQLSTQMYVGIKDCGDHRNYGEENVDIPDVKGTLHPFFREGKWKFLQFDGHYFQQAAWFLDEGVLTKIQLA